MHAMLNGSGVNCSDLARAAALLSVAPADLTATRRTAKLRSLVDRLLAQWEAESLDQLALRLGVNWIWFNEAERSGHMKRMPPLMSLALVLCGEEKVQPEARLLVPSQIQSHHAGNRAA
jgi:hypothetical protein